MAIEEPTCEGFQSEIISYEKAFKQRQKAALFHKIFTIPFL